MQLLIRDMSKSWEQTQHDVELALKHTDKGHMPAARKWTRQLLLASFVSCIWAAPVFVDIACLACFKCTAAQCCLLLWLRLRDSGFRA